MSRTASRPGLDELTGSVEQRVAILEALTPPTPNPLLDVTDGSLDIPDTAELFIGAGLTLTNPGAGIASIAADAGAVIAWTPALTASGSNPNLGVGGGTGGSYVKVGPLCTVFGGIQFLSGGVSAGTGDWEISLPFPTAGGGATGFYLGAAAHFRTQPADTNLWALDAWCNPAVSGSTFKLVYTPTWPVGAFTPLDSTSLAGSPWTLASGDSLAFQFTYLVDP